MNLSGISASFSAVLNPSILLPRLIVSDINSCDWTAFKQKGVRGIVIDKDQCITRPGVEELVPSLASSWNDALATFGPENILIVSNSAGTNKDSLLLQAETLSRHLHVPVLIHAAMKPSPHCASSIAHYFSPPSPFPPIAPTGRFGRWLNQSRSRRHKELKGAVVWNSKQTDVERFKCTIPPNEEQTDEIRLLVIGDRITTDMILASRLNRVSSFSTHPPFKTISILTTSLHAREGLGTTFLRTVERGILRLNRERMKRINEADAIEWESCLRPSCPPPPPPLSSLSAKREHLGELGDEALRTLAETGARERWSPIVKWGRLFDEAVQGTERLIQIVEKEIDRTVQRSKVFGRLRN